MNFVNQTKHNDALVKYLINWTMVALDIKPPIHEFTLSPITNPKEKRKWHGWATWSYGNTPYNTIEINIVHRLRKPFLNVKFPFVYRINNTRELLVDAIAHELLHCHFESGKHMRIYRGSRKAVRKYRQLHT